MAFRQPFFGDYAVTQDFGETITDPKGHTGIDYACPIGTPILTADDGYVIFAGNNPKTYGKYVVISHGNGYVSYYAHLSELKAECSQRVKKGQVIGLSGNTGNSTGPHLHFEIRDNSGKPIDPKPLMQCVEDSCPGGQASAVTVHALKGADSLGRDVVITAPAGAWGWNKEHTRKVIALKCGTEGTYTGNHTEHNGLEYCEILLPLWIAVNDGETQIINNKE